MTQMNLPETKGLVEQSLGQIFDNLESVTPELTKAMAYSVLSGGKRLRPLFVLATADAFRHKDGKTVEAALVPACAIELVHTYSLIHDDLPAMDDDQLRHGVASCHIKFGEDQAILAGDALQTLAFELLSAPERFGMANAYLSVDQKLQLINCLAKAIGTTGMAGGQSLDVLAPTTATTVEQLEIMHAAKTGALFEAAIVAGGLVAEVEECTLVQLSAIGQKIGYAFQIVDDILDATQSTKTLGKPAASDAGRGKCTFVDLLGIDESKARAHLLLSEIVESLKGLKIENGMLLDLAQQAVKRRF